MTRATRMPSEMTKRARELRGQQTKAESLLWSVLRAKRLCGLKFRRQYAIGPFFADFACVARKVIVELDGGYHDYQYEDDLRRQRNLENLGWRVMRFPNEDVLEDVEAVAASIAKQLGLEVRFGQRKSVASGMKSKHFPSPAAEAATSPRGEVTGCENRCKLTTRKRKSLPRGEGTRCRLSLVVKNEKVCKGTGVFFGHRSLPIVSRCPR